MELHLCLFYVHKYTNGLISHDGVPIHLLRELEDGSQLQPLKPSPLVLPDT